MPQHAAGDQIAWASAFSETPPPDENPFEPSGTLQDVPEAVVRAALEVGARAWAGVTKDATEVRTPIPPVPVLPAATAAAVCALDAAVHAWDIAVATGQRSPLTPALAAVLLAAAPAVIPAGPPDLAREIARSAPRHAGALGRRKRQDRDNQAQAGLDRLEADRGEALASGSRR